MNEYMTWSELAISLLILIGFGVLMRRMGQANPESTGKLGRRVGSLERTVSGRFGEVEKEIAAMDGRVKQIEQIVSELPNIREKQNSMATQLSATASDVKLIARQVDRLYDVIVPKGMQ